MMEPTIIEQAEGLPATCADADDWRRCHANGLPSSPVRCPRRGTERSKRPNGSGSIAQHKGRWWARMRLDGKRVSLGMADTPEQAEALIEAMKRRLAEGSALVEEAAREPASFVYFIQEDVAGGAMKIGRAKDPMKRLLALQTGSPRPLRLACVIPGGCHLEAALHAAFDGARINGEWFDPTKAMLALVEELGGAR